MNVRHAKADRGAVGLGDLENEDVLLLDEGHCVREQALEICKSGHANANVNFRASSLETVRQMVAANMGVTLMPELAAKPLDEVRYLSFEGEGPQRKIGLFWHEATPRNELLFRFAEILKVDV